MRINVYSQELTSEVVEITKTSNTERIYHAAQLILHSSPMLHHPPEDDDRSAVTFWLPKSQHRREEMACAFERIAEIFRNAKREPVICETSDIILRAQIDAQNLALVNMNSKLLSRNTMIKELCEIIMDEYPDNDDRFQIAASAYSALGYFITPPNT